MGSRSDAVASASLAKGWTQQGVLMAKKFTFRRKNEQLSSFQLEKKDLRELRMQMADWKVPERLYTRKPGL